MCYRIMFNIQQAEEHVSNQELYRRTGQRPIREIVRARQLKFTGHCLRMNKEEYANIYALYKSEVGQNPIGRPRETYLDQISKYVSGDKRIKLTADEIARMASDKGKWRQIVVPKKHAR